MEGAFRSRVSPSDGLLKRDEAARGAKRGGGRAESKNLWGGAEGKFRVCRVSRKLNTRGKLLVKWLVGNARTFVRFTTSEDSSRKATSVNTTDRPLSVLSCACTYVISKAANLWRTCRPQRPTRGEWPRRTTFHVSYLLTDAWTSAYSLFHARAWPSTSLEKLIIINARSKRKICSGKGKKLKMKGTGKNLQWNKGRKFLYIYIYIFYYMYICLNILLIIQDWRHYKYKYIILITIL